MRTTKLMAGALTLLVLVGGAAAAETVQSSEGTVYTLPANVSRIEEYAFYGDGELREIRIPEGVTEIGDYAFANCWYLTEITIPESVTKIGAHAFDNCVSLKTVQLSDNITEMGGERFLSLPQPDGNHPARVADGHFGAYVRELRRTGDGHGAGRSAGNR